ncbi:MAG TPA: hypothetical protein VKR79_01130 [Gaiellaceae bacterium]|nr:hypothetical protein [Gaiellaceae bacterium]
MPTYERLRRFDRDYVALTPDQRRAFKEAVGKFVEDLERGKGFRKGLRVKGVQGAPGVFEMTWADNGRATFSFGRSIREDEPHVVWHRVGTHDVI